MEVVVKMETEKMNVKISDDKIKLKLDVWKALVVILAILLVISWVKPFSGGISKGEAKNRALTQINSLLQGQAVANVLSVEEQGNLYKLEIDINGELMDSYMTKDGSLLFPNAIDLNSPVLSQPTQTGSSVTAAASVEVSADDDPSIGPKDAPVEIIEFSCYQCPYSARGTQTIKQVIET